MFKRTQTGRDCKLEGWILCKARFKFGFPRIISTYATVNGIAYDDWQEDGGFYHNEGWIDYDEKDIKPLAPDEYKVINAKGNVNEGESEIIEILEILENWLEEVEV